MSAPHSEPEGSASFIPIAIAFEGGLGLVAVALGWVLGHPPAALIDWTPDGPLWGAVATLPLALLLWACVRLPWPPLRNLVRMVDGLLVPYLAKARMVELILIAGLAGLGEELLFRGVLQNVIAGWVGGTAGVWIGCVLAAAVFAALHWLTTAYAVFALLVGLYLGCLWIATGNLLVPIVAHGLYDWIAMVYLLKVRPRNGDREPLDVSSER